MKYFNDCKSIDEIRARYKRLAKENHPDRGGVTETMQAINSEYAYACACIYKGKGFDNKQTDEHLRMSEAYREAIQKIIHIPGIVVELVGHWIWVTGETREVKDQLKEANFLFAFKKKAWYFRADEYRTRGGKKSLAQIRSKYGSQIIRNEEQNAIYH